MSLSILLRALTSAVLCVLCACGGGGGGGGGGAQGQALLAAPQGLRIEPDATAPQAYQLRWEATDQLGGDSDRYLAFHAPIPITPDNIELVISQEVEGTTATFILSRDDGMHYFRVAAVDDSGDLGELSEEIAVDTADRIYYRIGEGANAWGLYSVRRDGSDRRDLGASTFVNAGTHRVSPLGDRIAYLGSRAGTAYTDLTIYCAPTDGSGPALELPPLSVDHRSIQVGEFSPDGRWLTYRATVESDGDFSRIYVARTDIAQTGRLLSLDEGTASGNPQFTPDGREVVYPARSTQDSDSLVRIFARPVDGSTSVRTLSPESGPAAPFATGSNIGFSPSGDRLAYITREQIDQDEFVRRLYVVPTAGGEPLQLDAPAPAFTGGAEEHGVFSYAWSPDGRWMAYEFWYAGGGEEMFVVPADGSEAGRSVHGDLSSARRVSSPRFTHDSEGLLFTASDADGNGSELYRTTVESSGPVTVVNAAMVAGGAVTQYFLAPSGDRVLYMADALVDGRTEIFIVDLATPGLAGRVNAPLPSFGDVLTPSFSPDGQWVTYRADAAIDSQHLGYVSPSDGSSTATLVAGGGSTSTDDRVGALSWPAPGEQY